MLSAALIGKKRDGLALSEAEIRRLVAGITDQSVTDAQIAAFTMAVWFQGLSAAEQVALTLAMRDSGAVLRWVGLPGPVLDKHSTGGVGDLVSLVLGPMIAASGGFVPMISGRGLGHTGGTLDKLESIPGVSTALDCDRFQRIVREVGVAIVGQTDSLAPADRRIYAVRDVTATVDSIPLIVSSILSKKLAEGLDALAMDIKVGSGAFMQTDEEAMKLGREICQVAVGSGVQCNALITDMNRPLAWSAGNALEVREAIDFLTGQRRHPRLQHVVCEIAAELLVMGGLQSTPGSALERLNIVLADGTAAECFARMIAAQGGPVDLLDQPDTHLPRAPIVRPVLAATCGWVSRFDMQAIGSAVVALGGGRRRAQDLINPAVGISDLLEGNVLGAADTVIAVVHAGDEKSWQVAADALQAAITIQPDEVPNETHAVVKGRITGGDIRAGH